MESECECPPLPDPEPERVPPAKQRLRLQVERRKKGKQVTVIRDLHELDQPDVLTELKNVCGAGGTIKEQVIEIQGDHLERVQAWLRGQGYKTN